MTWIIPTVWNVNLAGSIGALPRHRRRPGIRSKISTEAIPDFVVKVVAA